jgi:two-component system nitrate/nitrite response regulator NarL
MRPILELLGVKFPAMSNVAEATPQDAADLKVPTYLVGPSAILRSGIEHSLAQSQFQVIASVDAFERLKFETFHDGRESLFIFEATVRHGKALQDLGTLKADHPGARGVILVESCEPENVLAAYNQGIEGYLTTSVSAEALRAYLALVMIGESVISSSALAMMSDTAQLLKSAEPSESNEPWDGVDRRSRHGLSYREASILRCLMDGDSNKVIARKCDITESTVKVHVKSICRKLCVSNRTKAALWAKSHLPRVERRSNRS